MATKILIRRDTAANWTANNPVLFQGEIGYDLTNKKLKIGDGSTNWNSLEYYQGDDATEVSYSNSISGLSASTVQSAIDEIEGRVDTNESDINLIEGRLDTIEGDFSVEGSIEKAELDSKNYTDAREIAITTAYESYADQAEADAITTANNYTDAREIAITTAYESYADQAEADAKNYADNQIDAAKLALGTNFSVPDIAARDALQDLTVGDIVFVADDGDSKWAQYKVTSIGPVVFLKIMDQDLFLNALSASNVKAAYESNADTNAFTDAIKNRIETTGTIYTVANYTEADGLENLVHGDLIWVLDTGSGKWELDMYVGDDSPTEFITVSTLSLLENASEASSVKSAYESNSDTNAFTDSLLSKLNLIEENAKDDQNANEVPFVNTDRIYATGSNLQEAIEEFDIELVSQSNRLDVIEGDSSVEGSIAKVAADLQLVADDLNQLDTDLDTHALDTNIHFTQADISITESQISDLQNYEPVDLSILRTSDLTTIFEDTALTGVPTAPTATTGTNTIQIATTAFVQASLAAAQTIDGGEF